MLGLAVLSACFAAQDAGAVERFQLVNASGACQSALPVFDGNIRKRPTAVSNEGSAPAFVSCSLYSDFNSAPSAGLGLLFSNNTGAAAQVNCTLVNGVRFIGEAPPLLIPKTFTVAANSSLESAFTADDNGGEAFQIPSFNLNCRLPVGVEINSLYTIYEDGSAPAG